MKEVKDFQNKKVLVLGLARSGMSAAKLLEQLGAFVVINDLVPLEDNPLAKELLAERFEVITGHHPIDLFDKYQFDYIVKNPGIPYTNVMIKEAVKRNLPIITEVELAWYISEASILGITGTNGKTTTTMMINEVLNHYCENYSVLAGNIGYPASTVAKEVKSNQLLTIELSSFQLMGTINFHPKLALITNIFEAHLDYHQNRQEYVDAKWKIQANMTEDDYLVLNGNQEELFNLAKKTRAQVIYFARNKKVNGAYDLDGKIYYQDEYIMDIKMLSLPGDHNIENALATITIAKLCHIPNEVIRNVLSEFAGVKHRMQYVATIKDVAYYNDSKATNILATKRALSGFDNQSLILIVGGLDRHVDFSELSNDLVGLKGLITFGETREQLYQLGQQLNLQVEKVQDVAEAVNLAYKWSVKGDKVLLSPANASWDQYKNFEERGNHFIDAVEKLKGDS